MKKEKGGKLRSIYFLLFLGLLVIFSTDLGYSQEPGELEKAAVASEVVEVQQWKVLATSPGVKVLSESIAEPGLVLGPEQNPLDAAYDWLAGQGFEEGRNLFHNKLLYVSVGAAVINASPSHPDYIDSRYLAFQRAELEAKAKTAIFLGVDLATQRGSSEREINPRERAELEELVNTSPTLRKKLEKEGIADEIYALFKKTLHLADAKLDRALEDAGVDVKGEKLVAEKKKADQQKRQNKIARLGSISQASVKACASAFSEVAGVQTIQSFEGSYRNGYQVVVITLWSQNMQRMVDIMSRGVAPDTMAAKKAKAEITKQLPEKPEELATLTGVRAYINQYGEHVLLSFGQAGVEVLGGREDKAYELSGKKARLRSMAAIRTFMGERVAFGMTEELKEALGLYINEAQDGEDFQEYKSVSQFQELIKTQAERQRIKGIYSLASHELVHPFTDRAMVLKIMAWSPASMEIAEEVKTTIREGADAAEEEKAAKQKAKEVTKRKGLVTSGKGADKDAY